MIERLALLMPWHWHTWAGLGFLRLIEPLPYSMRLTFGRFVGRLLQSLPLSYVRIARRNIALCFPALSDLQRIALLRRHFESLGIGIFETAVTWWSKDRRVCQLAKGEGLEH